MRSPDLRTANTTAASRITMSRAQRVWVNTDHQNPGAGSGATRNSSRVAAAAPRFAPPADSCPDAVATMSLTYAPGLAWAGTTSCSGIWIACFGASCTEGMPGWTQDGGTGRLPPRGSRCTVTRIDSRWVPALTTDTGGSARLWPGCATPDSRTGPAWMPTPTLAWAACGTATRAPASTAGASAPNSPRRCMSQPRVPLRLLEPVPSLTAEAP